MKRAFQQLQFLAYEVRQMNNTRWWRWANCWFAAGFWSIASYRFDGFCYLLLGKFWPPLRVLLAPFLFAIRPWIGRTEIHYRADIGKGLKVLHPTLGIIVSGKTKAGEHLTLTGGNCIGGRKRLDYGDIQLGDHVNLGANAVILGPVSVGSNVNVGAGAVVVRDVPDNQTVVGVPAVSI